jgi:hypothetical protein
VEATTRPGVGQLMRIAGPGNSRNPQRAQPAQARRGRASARMPACVTPQPIASHQCVLACTGPAGDPRTGVAKRGQVADMSELPLRILMHRPAPAFVISHAVKHMTERRYPSSGWASCRLGVLPLTTSRPWPSRPIDQFCCLCADHRSEVCRKAILIRGAQNLLGQSRRPSIPSRRRPARPAWIDD